MHRIIEYNPICKKKVDQKRQQGIKKGTEEEMLQKGQKYG